MRKDHFVIVSRLTANYFFYFETVKDSKFLYLEISKMVLDCVLSTPYLKKIVLPTVCQKKVCEICYAAIYIIVEHDL